MRRLVTLLEFVIDWSIFWVFLIKEKQAERKEKKRREEKRREEEDERFDSTTHSIQVSTFIQYQQHILSRIQSRVYSLFALPWLLLVLIDWIEIPPFGSIQVELRLNQSALTLPYQPHYHSNHTIQYRWDRKQTVKWIHHNNEVVCRNWLLLRK